jgi:hypothetical protein
MVSQFGGLVLCNFVPNMTPIEAVPEIDYIHLSDYKYYNCHPWGSNLANTDTITGVLQKSQRK